MTFISCTSAPVKDYAISQQFREGKFHNLKPMPVNDSGTMMRILWRYITEKRQEPVPVSPVPVHALTTQQLHQENNGLDALYRLGHSSLLLNLNKTFWLIDPVFGDRASPFNWIGPARFHKAPLTPDQLPEITGVIISHDHYDHLDQFTVQHLKDKVKHFIVPLGVGQHLMKWGVNEQKITELDWWQQTLINGVSVTATPSQHFSGRGLSDGNSTLWASWVIRSEQSSLFYSGDSGYFDGFQEIGQKFGPFDLTIMENGAYDKMWANVHMHPEETLQAHQDVQGKNLLPVHNSTFDLAFHDWHEPLNRLQILSEQASVTMVTPEIGQRMNISESAQYQSRWWNR
ncbi:MBL fold metallo-hydrolase [Oceanospirillum sediminis]|nr:MBL fold metallo-hydrolase [Oceanospirillum sediminis]